MQIRDIMTNELYEPTITEHESLADAAEMRAASAERYARAAAGTHRAARWTVRAIEDGIEAVMHRAAAERIRAGS